MRGALARASIFYRGKREGWSIPVAHAMKCAARLFVNCCIEEKLTKVNTAHCRPLYDPREAFAKGIEPSPRRHLILIVHLLPLGRENLVVN